MALSTILGFPRIGVTRSLKTALEDYWAGKITADALQGVARELREIHWHQQQAAGIDLLPSNDFSFYDQMLDMACLLGVVPRRYGAPDVVGLDTYFAMARGAQRELVDVEACEMTKWFDTNYHYIVPEFCNNQPFRLASTKLFDEQHEAQGLGLETRPVLVGPISFLRLGKGKETGNLEHLDRLLPVYEAIVQRLAKMGVAWVQFDEPCLALDLDDDTMRAMEESYERIRRAADIKIFVASYFGPLGPNREKALHLPIDALHLDLVRGREDLEPVLAAAPSSLILSMGLVDGRNVWRNDLEASLNLLERASEKVGLENIWVSSSCSLLHAPYDLSRETGLDDELKGWMAFAQQKMEEIVALKRGLNEGRSAIHEALVASDHAASSRKTSTRLHRPEVAARLNAETLHTAGREQPFSVRSAKQIAATRLPFFPTTTIGSFPQTAEVRQKRAAYRQGKITSDVYESFIKEQIKQVVAFQNEVGLDVLVHGEFERTDMVEYFAEKLEGFAFTKNGWVQSYGSRCVKPPVIYSDVQRLAPMTVDWITYAQSLTTKPMKGMLTGPVTILQWSFVRDDQPRRVTAHQIALALQDEVLDLERAGIGFIQIDEPAFREGLPLRRADWTDYLTWATQAFRLSSTGVKDETQIHTHMCYSEFNDIIDWIKELDADVISVEASRSKMELLDAFLDFHYPNAIGPGVYDIHSPRVPSTAEMTALLEEAVGRLDEKQIWVNPDCGLKTRGWTEVKAALHNMVAAAEMMRAHRALRRPA